MQPDELRAKAQAWADQDPDAETRAELLALIAGGDEAALADRMGKRLEFGTAGLRGELGGGSNRMNRVLVAQAAAGLALFLRKNFSHPSVVIGFDGRINSDVFARDSAEIMAAAGIETYLFDQRVPTPVLAFTVKQRDFSAGVMVTASHNPPRDNGYKVYLGGANGGGQIVSPADKEISAEIHKVAANATFDQIAKSDSYNLLGEEMITQYAYMTQQLLGDRAENKVKIVYSAMHGVGWHIIKQVFEAVGIPEPITVTEQLLPDADFPTVDFPAPGGPIKTIFLLM